METSPGVTKNDHSVTWTAVCSVVGCFNNHWYNYIIVFPLKYYLQHVSVLTECSCMWTISWFVFPSSPRVMSAPWRLSLPLLTLYSDQSRCGGNCVNLLIRPPRRSCTANIQTHLLPLCVSAAGEWKWLKVDAICIHENNENLLMGVFKSGTKCWDIVLLCLCFSCERSPALLLSLLNRTDGGGVMCTHTHAAERRVSERNNWIGGLWSLHSKPELWQLPGDALPPSLLCALCMQDWRKMYSDVLLKD